MKLPAKAGATGPFADAFEPKPAQRQQTNIDQRYCIVTVLRTGKTQAGTEVRAHPRGLVRRICPHGQHTMITGRGDRQYGRREAAGLPKQGHQRQRRQKSAAVNTTAARHNILAAQPAKPGSPRLWIRWSCYRPRMPRLTRPTSLPCPLRLCVTVATRCKQSALCTYGADTGHRSDRGHLVSPPVRDGTTRQE